MKSTSTRSRQLVALALAAGAAAACATTLTGPSEIPREGLVIRSPGGRIQVRIAHTSLEGTADYPKDKRLYYQLESKTGGRDAVLLPWSPLGVRLAGQDLVDGLTLTASQDGRVEESYEMVHGKRRHCSNRGIEKRLGFRNGSGGSMVIVFRVFDDGIGFRYEFPGKGAVELIEEVTGFRPPPEDLATLMQHGRPGDAIVAYENPWHAESAVGAPAPTSAGWSFPALFYPTDREHIVLVTEAGLEHGHAATHLGVTAGSGVYRIAYPLPEEAGGEGKALPVSTLPWTTPWRVIVAGDLDTIFDSTLVTDLAPASIVADTSWIRPGRSTGDLLATSVEPGARMQSTIDLASTLGWEHWLIDPRWTLIPDKNVAEFVGYATKQRVSTWLRYGSGIPQQPAPQAKPPAKTPAKTPAPLSIMMDPTRRKTEMQRISSMGVKGILVDTFGSDKPHVISLYLDILKDAAEAHLMVRFRGCTLPRGWQRTYPHLLTMGAVQGAEGYQQAEWYAKNAPWHNTIQVFARNVVGSMDYSPVSLSKQKYPRVTTEVHELALAVVFESGLQHFADDPAAYLGLRPEVLSILQSAPAVWDESRLLEGAPGVWAVVARRSGRDWYIAGINGANEPRTLEVPLDMLENGTFQMTSVSDPKPGSRFTLVMRQRNAISVEALTMDAHGGFIIKLTPFK